MDNDIFQLPGQVIGRVDVGRLLREVEALDNFMKQAAIRQPGTPLKMPKTSRMMDEMVTNNKLNLLREDDRVRLLKFLQSVKSKAPIMHMSFSADPSPSFLTKLVAWLRTEIHPLVLVQIGLQPNIGAGAIVRTTNKHFDFSLRQRFKKEREKLVDKLHVMSSSHTPVATAAQPAPLAAPAQPAVPQAAAAPTAATTPSEAPIQTPEELAKQVEAVIQSMAPEGKQ